MIDPAQFVFNPEAAQTAVFAPTSRYYGLPVLTHETENGDVVAYVARRFLPALTRLTPIGYHVVNEGERGDHIAAAALGDGELFWRICDANAVLDPSEIERVGRRLRIAMPEGG